MPLIMVGIGETCTIQRIGGSEETRRFLANLGFCTGSRSNCIISNWRKCHCEH